MSWSRVSLFCYLVDSFISANATRDWYPAKTDSRAFITQYSDQVHDKANESVFSIFALNHLQVGHCVRIDYWLYRIHVPVKVQCQKMVVVKMVPLSHNVWNGWRSRCPLAFLGSIDISFVMWSLGITLLIEVGLAFSPVDRTFVHHVSEAVSLWIEFKCSCWRAGANWVSIGHRRYHSCSTLEPIRPRHPLGLGTFGFLVVQTNACSAWSAGWSMQAWSAGRLMQALIFRQYQSNYFWTMKMRWPLCTYSQMRWGPFF